MTSARPRTRRGYQRADSEGAFQSQVIGLLRFYGWRIWHQPAGGKAGRVDTEQVGKGFPDLVAVRAPRLIFAELKADTAHGRRGLTADQRAWLEDLGDVGGAVDDVVYVDERQRVSSGPGYVAPSVEAYLWTAAGEATRADLLAGNPDGKPTREDTLERITAIIRREDPVIPAPGRVQAVRALGDY